MVHGCCCAPLLSLLQGYINSWYRPTAGRGSWLIPFLYAVSWVTGVHTHFSIYNRLTDQVLRFSYLLIPYSNYLPLLPPVDVRWHLPTHIHYTFLPRLTPGDVFTTSYYLWQSSRELLNFIFLSFIFFLFFFLFFFLLLFIIFDPTSEYPRLFHKQIGNNL